MILARRWLYTYQTNKPAYRQAGKKNLTQTQKTKQNEKHHL